MVSVRSSVLAVDVEAVRLEEDRARSDIQCMLR